MIPAVLAAPDDVAVVAVVVIVAAVVDVAADQFSTPFVHMIVIRWYD